MAFDGHVPEDCIPVQDSRPGFSTGEEHEAALHKMLFNYISTTKKKISSRFGFPSNLVGQVGELDFMANTQLLNIGDPFVYHDSWANTNRFEVGVLDWFAALWEIEKPHYWGYMTTGGSESTMYSLYTAREEHPNGIVYTSEDMHYSIYKAARMLKMPITLVSSTNNGEIDYSDLKNKLRKNVGRSAIIVANIGTTMKGAIDDIEKIVDILKAAEYSREDFHIHCDAAFFGLMLPFAEKPSKLSFRNPIDSISVSGHKFLGCPLPCSILISRKSHRRAIGDSECISVPDTTVSGCRSGHAALYMWYLLSKKGKLGIEEDVKNCLENAELLQQLLTNKGVSAYKNSYSNIVVFDNPNNKEIVDRWHLAYLGSIAHVVVSPHMSKHNIEKFASELGACHNSEN